MSECWPAGKFVDKKWACCIGVACVVWWPSAVIPLDLEAFFSHFVHLYDASWKVEVEHAPGLMSQYFFDIFSCPSNAVN